MARVRSYRRHYLIEALVIAAGVQGAAIAGYEVLRPEPDPVLAITVAGDGDGTVNVFADGRPDPVLRCDGSEVCRLTSRRGVRLHMVAVPGERSTFEGWSQLPMRTPPQLRKVAGDPLAACLDFDLDPTNVRDVQDCGAELGGDLDVGVSFGLQPDEVQVAFERPPLIDGVVLPRARPPADIDAEKLEDDAIELAIAPMPAPAQIELPPPPAVPPESPPMSNMRMVEVQDDDSVVDTAPDDATHLSDKNRDVADETHATETNLERESRGEEVASIESADVTSPEIGGPDDLIRQLEAAEATTDDRIEATDHSGTDEVATGELRGDGGDDGQDGIGLLAMRGIGGRGSIVEQRGDGKKRGDKGLPGVNTALQFRDYERILGKDRVEEERQVAARKMSAKRGRWERKLAAIKSSLENFTPDIRPGNQTALKTRAHPFALFVARMHRRIHELWGFGFLESLDDKPADFALNDFDLFVNIELSVNPDGSVHKTTIAKTSGKLEFDVAALDTILSAAPYDRTPEAIRSVDGRVYLRWGFYRNWRQCGTFNVEPYILTEIPGGAEPIDDGAMVKSVPKRGTRVVTPSPAPSSTDRVGPTTAIKEDQAAYAANLWVSGFATGQVDKMVRFSATPFRAGGEIAAQTSKDLRRMYTGLVVESGKLKDWKLVTVDEYAKNFGTQLTLGDSGAILVVTAEKATFAIVLQRTRSGDYRATYIIR